MLVDLVRFELTTSSMPSVCAFTGSVSCIARINQIIEEKKLLEVTGFAAEIDRGVGQSESGEVGRRRGR